MQYTSSLVRLRTGSDDRLRDSSGRVQAYYKGGASPIIIHGLLDADAIRCDYCL